MQESPLFRIARDWESLAEVARKPLRTCITELVGYPCKLACQANNGSVDIVVLNSKRGTVCDWLEIQPSGALGVVWDQYPDSTATAVIRLSDACDEYNDRIGVWFDSESEGEDGDAASESSEDTYGV